MTTKNKIIKSISALLIISIMLPAFLFSKPQHVQAQGFVPTNDAVGNKLLTAITKATGGTLGLDNKNWIEYLGEQILKMVAKRILAQMTQATINWINSGFHGAPLFLEDPESFFKDIRKSVVRSLVDMIGYDEFRFPFGKQTALNVIESYKSQLETNAQYSLYNVLNNQDLVLYRTDFNYGGWNGFLINTQYPQNNYLGFNMLIGESLGSQLTGTLQSPAERVQSALQQGMGFLSPQTCADNGGNNEYNKKIGNQFVRPSFKSELTYETQDSYEAQVAYDEQYEANLAEEKATWAASNTCQNLVSTTPGFVAANQISNSLDSPRMMTVLDGALGNSFAAIFDALLNKLLGDGLTALSSTINPEPENINWSYEGQTLDRGTGVPTSTDAALNINNPEHSVSLNVTTSATNIIAGGIGPYSIQTPTLLNTSIATVTVTPAGFLTINATGNSGETAVAIKDSSDPARITIINIQVNNPANLTTFPKTASINVGDTTTATISGGVKPYLIQTNPNQTIAIAGLADNVLLINGVAQGITETIIRDSSNPIKTFNVPITVRESATFSVTQESILLNPAGDITERGIAFNDPIITNSNPNVVNVGVNGTTLIFTSKNITGQTTITARGPNHSLQNPQISEFDITVADSLTYRVQQYGGNSGGNGINIDTSTQSLPSNTRYIAFISGGLAPYNVISYSSGIFTEKPRFLNENRLYFVLKSGISGSSGSINVGSASGQIININFTVN